MTEKKIPTGATMDLARICLGAYQGLDDDCPACISDGEVYGMVNECKFGDQCWYHACYCNHPKATWRKCGWGWRSGGIDPDRDCPLFEPNPYWRECGDFEKSREATIAHMKALGKLKEVSEEEPEGSSEQ